MAAPPPMTNRPGPDGGQPMSEIELSDVEKSARAPPAQTDEAEENYKPKTLKFWLIIVSIFLALFLVALDRTILGTAIPQITVEFQSLGDIGWYGSAYMLTTSASQLVFGRVYRFYDLKRVFLACVAVFEIGSVICGAAPNSIVFIVGRAIAGFGGAGIFSGVMIIMIPMVPLHKRPMFQGLFGMVFGVSSVLGPLVGGAFTTSVTWRWCFYINLPIGAFSCACVILFLHTPKKPPQKVTIKEQIMRLDPIGTFFFVPSIVCLLLALQWGGSVYAWNEWRIILLMVLFGVLFLAFAAVQILMPNTATVPPKVITQQSIFAGAIFMFCLAGSMLMTIYFLPLWFQTVLGANAVQSGIDTLPFVLSMVVASILSGAFTQRIGYYVPAMILSSSLMAVGQGLLSTLQVNIASSHWIGFQIISGFGLGIGMQSTGLAAQTVLPKPDVPTGVSIMFFTQQLGGAIFTSVGQNILSEKLIARVAGVPGVDTSSLSSEGATDIVNHVPEEFKPRVLEAYNFAITRIFLVGMGLALLAVIFALCMEWKNVKKNKPGPPPPGKSASVSSSSPSTMGPPNGIPPNLKAQFDGAADERGQSNFPAAEASPKKLQKSPRMERMAPRDEVCRHCGKHQ